MTNENKLASMDAVGELPDFGNLLLREGGYPHLESNMQEMHNAFGAKLGGSQSDAWNDASILPTECKVYETQGETWGFAYQYWNGVFWACACAFIDDAKKSLIREFYETTKWREVQP